MSRLTARVAAALLLTIAAVTILPPAGAQAPAAKVYVGHGMSMHGDLKYGPGFKHFEWANPDAPKGGDVKMATVGTFDNLNPFILKGHPAVGLRNVFETLTVSSADEPFSQYGLIAETIEVPADRSWVAFALRPEARFHDGSSITADDVVWTFETLKTKGHPQYRAYYAQVTKAEKVGERKVKFTFGAGDNRELPLIVGQLPVLPRAWWSKREFDKTTLEPPLGSGPYKVDAVEQGRSITYRRVKDYWGAKLAVARGRDNFNTLRYDFYRDQTVLLEAFKGGEYDFRQENSAKNWATAYTFPAVEKGLVKKEEIRHENPTPMQGFVYNTRRPLFQDRRVRQALAHAFDFEWSNKNLFHGQYARTKSYFSNTELASRGLPSPEELKVLEPFRGKVPEEVFTREYQPPVTDGSGNIREGARDAVNLLKEAGWVVKGQKLVNDRGEPFQFEILIQDPQWERIALPFAKNLERLGITARVRTVDAAQYEKRTEDFDFDMTVDLLPQSLSPGNEQRDFWGSPAADTRGSRNTAGIKDPVVDKLIDLVIQASDRAALVTRTRALDRVLLSGHYVIPHFYLQAYRIAYWDKFGRPARSPKYSLGFDSWWVDPKKEAALSRRKGELAK
jgi:microcin C transport system substrate-binding protein